MSSAIGSMDDRARQGCETRLLLLLPVQSGIEVAASSMKCRLYSLVGDRGHGRGEKMAAKSWSWFLALDLCFVFVFLGSAAAARSDVERGRDVHVFLGTFGSDARWSGIRQQPGSPEEYARLGTKSIWIWVGGPWRSEGPISRGFSLARRHWRVRCHWGSS